jgi:hypothetical protein
MSHMPLEGEDPQFRFRRLRRHTGTLLLAGSLILIPWTLFLAYTLPTRHHVVHWDAIWVGFDLALALALLLTAITAIRGRPWLAIPATASGTLLVCDAWFDILTARGTHQIATALLEAVLVELPLAGLCVWMALRVERILLRRIANRRVIPRKPYSGPSKAS